MEIVKEKGMRALTYMQARAIDYLIEDKCRSKARALRKAGYSEAIAHQPHKVFGSPAVKRELFLLGIGEKLSQHQKKYGKTIEEWKKETEKTEAEERLKEEQTEAIKQIPQEQILWLKEKLMGIGYEPHNQSPRQEKEIPSFVPGGEIRTSENGNLPSFSSM